MLREDSIEYLTRSAPQYGVGFPGQPNLQGTDTAIFAARCTGVSEGFFAGGDDRLSGLTTHVVLFDRSTLPGRHAGLGPFAKLYLEEDRAEWVVLFLPVSGGFIDRVMGHALKIQLVFDKGWKAFGGPAQTDEQGDRFQFAEALRYVVAVDTPRES
ncbi:hypothetical protein [Psychromarinibacter sp. S121]|uniref:hypothetical protein n=1 Tax=Psychromarinibacter sp. S121 TaxID=3415127 RepID=UPI003C7B4DC6